MHKKTKKVKADDEMMIAVDPMEVKRLAGLEYENMLKVRYHNMKHRLMAGNQIGLSNTDLYFDQQILALKDKKLALSRLEDLEKENKAIEIYIYNERNTAKRIEKYTEIQSQLYEAVAEKEEGRPAKMEYYLALRAAIKSDFPLIEE